MKKERKEDIITYVIMLISGLLFYLLPGKWISIEDDSGFYLVEQGQQGVLPGYPAFLSFFRALFSEQYFLHAVVIAQSLLAVVCTFVFVLALKKRFRLKRLECILLYFCSMLPFSIYLPVSGITHQIMTEGITYALFYLFFITVMEGVWTLKYKWYLGSMAVAALLGLIRTQLLFLQAVCLLLLIWITFRRFGWKLIWKLAVCAFILAVGVLLVFGSEIQNMVLHSQLNTVILIRGFYEADEEDADLFDDAVMREIFTKAYEYADADGSIYTHARPDLYMWKDLVYDKMTDYAVRAINEYDAEYEIARTKDSDEIFYELGMKVLLAHFDRYLYHTIRLMMPSFIATVFFQIEPIYLLCHFITLFIYLFAVIGSIAAGRMGADRKAVEFMGTVICMLVIMVVVVNLLFIGLQRYVVYGMGIFYCAAYLLCREIIWCIWERSGKEWKWLKALIGERA